MNFYLQYHNVQNEGVLLSDPLFSATRLGIRTRRPNVQKADGRIFLIAGIGRPRRFFLWEAFEVEEISSNGDGEFAAFGTGWQLAPPVELTGKRFEEFKGACANFVGFRCINDLPFSKTLKKLAEENRPPGESAKIAAFLNTLDGLLADDDTDRHLLRSALGNHQPVRALSIRQPHAEAIMRRVKTIEYRSKPTKIRGRILIYASLGRYSARDESEIDGRLWDSGRVLRRTFPWGACGQRRTLQVRWRRLASAETRASKKADPAEQTATASVVLSVLMATAMVRPSL